MTLRLGVLTSSFPDRARDPAGGFVARMCLALATRGSRVEALVPRTPGASTEYDTAMAKKGVRVTRLPYAPFRSWETLFHGDGVPDNMARSPWKFFLAPAAIASMSFETTRRAARYDVLLTHWLLPCGVVGAQKSRTYFHAAFCHGSDLHLLESLQARDLARRIAAQSDALCFVSEHLRARFERLVGERQFEDIRRRTFVVPMGVDPAEVAFTTEQRIEARRRLGLRDKAVLFVGRLVPVKGADVLIDAAEHLPGWTVLIAGDGPLRRDLERRAAQKKIRARFFGRVGPERRRELLAAADAFVLPSRIDATGRSDNLPVSLLEAMAAGKTAIASDTGAVREIVAHGETGFVIPPENPVAIATAVEKLSEGEEFFCGDRARAAMVDRNWDTVACRLLKTIEDSLRRPGGQNPATAPRLTGLQSPFPCST